MNWITTGEKYYGQWHSNMQNGKQKSLGFGTYIWL